MQRAVALLRGGVPAAQVWPKLVDDWMPSRGESNPSRVRGDEPDQCRAHDAVSDLAAGGDPGWRALAAVWHVAEASGAPLAPTLDRFGRSLRALERVAERRSVLLAGPRATIRLIGSLPPVGLALSWLLGFDPLAAFGTPIAWGALLLGAALLVLGIRWAGAMTRRLAETDWIAGWEFELVAIAISGGGPPGEALRRAVDAADHARAEWVHLDALAPGGSVVRTLESAESLGTSIAPALLREAAQSRDRAQAELERAAERLGVRVLIPLGVCVLPAFILLGVVPTLMSVLGGGA